MTHLPSASLTQTLQELRPRVDAALDDCVRSCEGCVATLCDAMRYGLLGPGKRVRPILVLLANQACGGSVDSAMPGACAVEMVHAYSLIHDDLPAMDDDDMRRGRPSCHTQFGEAMAILAGDALLAGAFEILAEEVEPAEVAVACCAALARAAGATLMVGGQADDIQAESNRDNAADEDEALVLLESIHARKTGALISVALKMGGLIARADAATIEALTHYGDRLGLLFQLTDDLLDVQGRQRDVGKRVGKDTEQGKLTYPGLLGVAGSIERGERLCEEACSALTPVGSTAEPLVALAEHVLLRNR